MLSLGFIGTLLVRGALLGAELGGARAKLRHPHALLLAVFSRKHQLAPMGAVGRGVRGGRVAHQNIATDDDAVRR